MLTFLEKIKWRVRLAIFAALIVPLYVLPTIGRLLLVSWFGRMVAVVLSDVLGSLFVGFVTNNYRLGILLYLVATAFELLLVAVGHHRIVALWMGDAIPAMVSIYYAQQLFVNMGD